METGNFSDRLALAAAQNIKERDYWLEQLSGDINKSTFPYDYDEHEGGDGKIRRMQVTFAFPDELFKKAAALSNGSAVKLHMMLVTVSLILLNKYSRNGSRDIMIGSPILKQKKEGDFINKVLVFRGRLDGECTFKELLLRVRETIIEANENQNYPLELLADQMGMSTPGNRSPFFDVALLLRELHDKRYIEDVNYDVLFSFSGGSEGIEGVLEYNSRLYRKSAMDRIARHYMHLLDQVLTDVDSRVSQTLLMSEQEMKQVLIDFNNAVEDSTYPRDKPLHRLFEEQAARKPFNIALTAGSERIAGRDMHPGRISLTYDCLNENAAGLARLLREKGIKPGVIAGIIVDPTIEMMVGLLAILKAGGAYLPMDPDYPIERIRFMLADSNAKLVLTVKRLFNEKEKAGWWDGDTVFIDAGLAPARMPALVSHPEPGKGQPQGLPLHALNLPSHGGVAVGRGGLRDPNPDVGARRAVPSESSRAAYIIYTSGTTGKPKGVMVEHGNVVAYLHSFFHEFDIDERDTVVQLASYAFDVFIEEVFPVLLRGGKIFIPHMVEMMDIGLLSRLIEKRFVSIIDCTPLLLNEFNTPEICKYLQHVRIIISGGDVLKWHHVDNLLEVGQVYNTYGPTESTVCATYHKIDRRDGEWRKGRVPIGKPVSNYRVYILDHRGNPVPTGVYGELCVAGPGITRGYLNRPELTFENICQLDRSFSGGPGGRLFKKAPLGFLYKTGDLARWLPDGPPAVGAAKATFGGIIEFYGRIDDQVKIRGFRIEMGEIENCLRRIENVEEAAVTARTDKAGEKYICAYIRTGNQTGAVPEAGLREYLSQRLPYYMMPSHFVFIDKMPLNRNGKIDRKQLPEPGISSSHAYVPPGNAVEAGTAKIYAEILGLNIDIIGINDNFFELGGNSIKLIKLTAKIREVFGSNLPMMQILGDATVKHIAGLILENKLITSDETPMVLLNHEKPAKIFCFPPAAAYGLVYMELAALLHDYSVYAFNFIDIPELIERYAGEMLRVQPHGPFVLFAYSAGGKITMKTANLLEKMGHKVSAVILMECHLEIDREKQAEIDAKIPFHLESLKKGLTSLGAGHLMEQVSERIRTYMLFSGELQRIEATGAPIYYINAEDKTEKETAPGWERLTHSEYKVLGGFGRHDRMLEPGFLEKNAEIIKEILECTT